MAPTPRRLAPLVLLAACLAAGGCASDSPERLAVEDYLQNAQGYYDGGHFDQALVQFRRVLGTDPSNRKALLGEVGCLYWLGTAETSSGGRSILEAQERSRALEPDSYGENAWKVHLMQGMVQSRLCDLWQRKADLAARGEGPGSERAAAEGRERSEAHGAGAEASFRAVLEATDQPMARNNLTALIFLGRRRVLRASSPAEYQEGLDFFHRYEKEVEKSKALWVEMKKREPDLAATYEQKLRNAEKEEVELRDLVANVCFKLRRHEESIAELDRVIAIDPLRAAAFFNRGRNHEELGRYGAAADDYNRFLRLTELPSGSPLVLEATERMAACEDRVREKMGP